MPHLQRSALVSHSPQKMFELVTDIQSYPAFLPWCDYGAVQQINDNTVQATVGIAKGRATKRFTTQNELLKYERIHMELLDGPFEYLRGDWLFKPLGDEGCKISLTLDYKFKGGILSVMIAPVFSNIANRLVDSFCQRADQLSAS